MQADNYLVVFVTVPNAQEGESIARVLVSESLAACVNIVAGCRSVYRWQGELVVDDEVLMVVKTRRGLFDQLAARVNQLHSYDVPEVVAMSVEGVSSEYRKFLAGVLGGDV